MAGEVEPVDADSRQQAAAGNAAVAVRRRRAGTSGSRGATPRSRAHVSDGKAGVDDASGPALARSVGAGLVAAVVGGLAWAFLEVATGQVLGVAAWGLGALVGLAMAASGAAGVRHGLLAAALALAGIMGSKWLSADWFLEGEFEAWAQGDSWDLSVEAYDRLRETASLLQRLGEPDDAKLRAFLLDRGYEVAAAGGDADARGLAWYRETWAPYVEALHANQPVYADWRIAEIEFVRAGARGVLVIHTAWTLTGGAAGQRSATLTLRAPSRRRPRSRA